MATKRYNNYSDMITFSRASSGTALAKISYGSEMVTNGTFDTDSDWAKGSGWTISGGVASISGGSNQALGQDLGLDENTYYEVTLTVSNYVQGNLRIRLGDTATNLATINADGSYTFILNPAGSNGFLYLYDNNTLQCDVDNISIKEVLYDQADGTLQLFNHPANQPRVEYDYQGNRLGLLVEEARSNRLAQSEGTVIFTSYQGAAGTANAATAPDGTNNAMLLASTLAGNARNRAYSGNYSVTGGTTYTVSGFFKKQNVNVISLRVPGGNDAEIATFDFRTEQWDTSILSSYSPQTTVQKYPNGWYRISLTGTPPTNASSYFLVTLHGDDANPANQSPVVPVGDGVYIWGAQQEVGSFPTSYIPTSGVTATRSADVASIGVGAFGYNKTAGTVVLTADWYPGSNFLVSNRAALEIGDGGVSERFIIYNHDGFAGRGFMKGVLFGDQTGSGARITDGQTKSALVFADANQAHCVDGGSIDTGSAAMLAGTTIMKIGSTLRTGHISSIAYYPRRLTDAQIKALTSPPETPTLSLSFDGSSTSYLETNIHG